MLERSDASNMLIVIPTERSDEGSQNNRTCHAGTK